MLTELPNVKFISRFRLANIIETEVARSRIITNVIAEIDTITAVVACVVNGLGVSIAPWSALKETSGAVVAVPFGDPPIYRQIGLIERRASPCAAVIDRLHQHLVSFSGQFGVARWN